MRKTLLTLLAAISFAACSDDSVSPRNEDSLFLLDETAVLAFGSMDMADPGSRYIARLHRLPEHLKLSADQQARIKAILEAYESATKADREALAAIHRQAREAHQAGKSSAEVRAILAQGDPIRQRLHAAEQQLHAQIEAVLTAEQKAWLAANGPERCRGFALTDAQKTQITALIAAFQEANAADLATIKKAFEEARAAHQAGASRQQIAAILNRAAAAIERIRVAQIALDAAILALLTPEQRASGCFGPRLVGHR
jgi:Spy/CpxP family protein refolding chaperone